METILIVGALDGVASALSQAAKAEGYGVFLAKDGVEGITKIREEKLDLVITDLKLPKGDGFDLLRTVKEKRSSLPVIVTDTSGAVALAVRAMKEGAYDFITRPFDPEALVLQIKKALEKHRLTEENLLLKGPPSRQPHFPVIIGKTPAMLHAVSQMQRVALSNATVLITGESGTGKELFARAIHLLSHRRDNLLVAINCAAIPRELLESELFGHERGAFTSAVSRKIGKFELADKGTLFLDEMGDMDFSLQAKLMRVLEEDEVMRVGGVVKVKVDVRIVAATNRDLSQAISQKLFREDLYYRLNVFPIHVPPLRERREDIPALVDHFLSLYTKEMKKEMKHLSPVAIEMILNHPWTGNVRELQNCIERSVILCDEETILPEHLGLRRQVQGGISFRDIPMDGTLYEVSNRVSQLVESRMIQRVLEETHGNKSRAAKQLKVSYKTLLTKIKNYGIEKSEPALP